MEIAIFKLIYKPLIRSSARQILEGRQRDLDNPQNGRWTRKDINQILARTWRRVDRMAQTANLSKLPTRGSRNNVFLAAVTTAAYQELASTGASRDYAAQLVADVVWKLYGLGITIFSLPFRLTSSDPGDRVERTIKLLMKFPFSAPGRPAYEAKVWREGEETFTHWTWCPPQAFVRELIEREGDQGELDAFYQSWCLYDWPGADIMAGDGKCGHYERRLTQSKGDKVCDMCWKGKI